MISALHLLWIVPVCGAVGFATAALLVANRKGEEEYNMRNAAIDKNTSLAEACSLIHANAVAHGWWEDERDPEEIYALIHSEWSEALEEARAGRTNKWHMCTADDHVDLCEGANCSYHDNGNCPYMASKPEGTYVELIDGVLRIMDYLGKTGGAQEYNAEPATYYFTMEGPEGEEWTREVESWSLPRLINELHRETFAACALRRGEESDLEAEALLRAATLVWTWVGGQGLDPATMLAEKHAYNLTRPYKHGKKF